uniref:Uncharacterized protein n=1 Tax=Anguilla anguilla TaxID=7936 RepID=A0A0E9PE23_ANGAN
MKSTSVPDPVNIFSFCNAHGHGYYKNLLCSLPVSPVDINNPHRQSPDRSGKAVPSKKRCHVFHWTMFEFGDERWFLDYNYS